MFSYLEPPTCDDRILWDAMFAHLRIPAISLADELGLFSVVAGGEYNREEIGRRLSLDARACEVLLAVLMGMGLLEQQERRLILSPEARNFLLPESPYYRGALLSRIRGEKSYTKVRNALLPEPGLQSVPPPRETGELDREAARWRTAGMHIQSLPAAMGVARSGDFTGVQHLLDIGGGSGCFCMALAARYPDMRFTIMERPAVCSVAQEYIADAGMQERIHTYPADMFRDPWPSGCDAIFFSNIFHNWDRDRCLDLMRRSFEALPAGRSIYLHEALLSDTRNGPLTVALFSLAMMLQGEGKQFTAGELQELFEACGFFVASVTPTFGYYSLMVGRKPD